MIQTKIEIREVEVKLRICDFCQTNTTERESNNVCCMCGKDMCKKCTNRTEYGGNDYPDHYCKSCWEKGELYRKAVIEQDLIIDKLYINWINSCRNKPEVQGIEDRS